MSPAPQETRSRKPQAKRFDEFWNNAYPHKEKKIARGKCEAKYRLLVASGVDEEAIIGGARAYARSERVRDGIVCNPMTWLNARRWEDENAEIIPHPASRSPATSASPADPFKVTRNGQAQGQSRAFARRQEALARELDRGSRDDPSASLLPARGQ